MKRSLFPNKLLSWYEREHRDLPWRETKDPYKIWLSEVILQQTRVSQGLPYYERFVKNYPNVIALANALEDKVLRLWQGLGYYSRAKNLHKCAIHIKDQLGGVFPATYEELLKLPGVGRYTAAAIASFAYKEPVAVVDGNVSRVLARIYGVFDDISTGKGMNQFHIMANELLDSGSPDIHNQAIMEFGALHCTPKSPKCADCPFAEMCYAMANNAQNMLPIKTKKTKIKKRYFHYLVLQHEDKFVLKPRTEKDIWNGLYDFPLIELSQPRETGEVLEKIKEQVPEFGLGKLEISKEYKHVLSHQYIYTRFYHVQSEKKLELSEPKSMYYTLNEVGQLPKPVLIDKYLTDDIF